MFFSLKNSGQASIIVMVRCSVRYEPERSDICREMRSMRKVMFLLLAAGLVLVTGRSSVMAASASDTHDVTIQIQEIVALEVTGGNVSLTISAVSDPGALPDAVTDNSTALDWTSNVSSGTRSITAALDSAYSAGIVLKVALSAPAGTNGSSAGQITLGTGAQNVFTGITNENCVDATLTYEASLTQMVAPTSETRTVTYTLTDAA